MAAGSGEGREADRTAVRRRDGQGSRGTPRPASGGAARGERPPREARAAAGAPRSPHSGRPGLRERHGKELAALACLGLAVFLGFVLLAGSEGGALGDLSRVALRVSLGRLGFLVPVGLLALAVALVFELRPRWSSAWLYGTLLLLLALLLLVTAGFPPVGGKHPGETFARATYEARAGWLGELLFAGGVRLVGLTGVAIAGWLALLAAVSLLTGLTIRRTAEGTGRAARRARTGVEGTARRLQAGEAGEPGPLDDPYLSGFGPPVAEAPGSEEPFAAAVGLSEAVTIAGPHEYDEPTQILPGFSGGRDLHLTDGAEDFPDLYGPGAPLPLLDVPPLAAEQSRPGQTPPGSPVAPATPAAQEGSPGEASAAREARPVGHRAVADDEDLPTELFPETRALYVLPSAELLRRSIRSSGDELGGDRETAALLVETLSHFGVEARVWGMVTGPRVTRYELQLAPGTKVSKVAGLKDDLAYALASTEIRILAPIPGKSAVGVEVPNRRPTFVTLGDIYKDFPRTAGPLMAWLGKDISGKPVYTDLAKLPHLLIAGTTGSGKSGCVNCIISSVLLRARPDEVRMILIDPKKVELSPYERIPHLLVPVVTNMKNAAGVLANVVKEMENRYELMELERARHLDEMNKARDRRGEARLPYIVVVVDELADLMMVAPADVEEYIIRIAQKARAVGIHLVVATQRPSVDVITGMIKANIPSRIAFAVSSQTDSRVILDQNGAEALLGQGDMLFKPLGSSRLQRIQGAYITEDEIHELVTHARQQAEPEFREELLEAPLRESDDEEGFDPDEDELLADAAELVLDTGSASVSMLQRRLRVGYTRAGRLIDMLERRGIVGPYEGSKPRQILTRQEDRARVLDGLRQNGAGDELLADDLILGEP